MAQGKSLVEQGGRQWMALRQRVIQRDGGRCVMCGSTEQLQADHIQERVDGGGDSINNLQTLCRRCHKAKTDQMRRARANLTQSDDRRPAPMAPRQSIARHPSSRSRRALTGQEEPGEPRYFPDPHPDRAGSMVDQVAAHARDSMGIEFLPWQERVLDRLLEYDEQGLWCWPRAIVLVPRQSGKSTIVRALAEWRAAGGGTVLTTSAKLTTILDLMRDSQIRYRDQAGFTVRMLRDQPEIAWPGAGAKGHRWISQASNAMLGRGFTVDLAVIDEVQDVVPEAWESLLPSMLEVPNPLALSFGTAARGESELLNRLRDAGMKGAGVCHIEWSVPRDLDIEDEETWRLASPRWTLSRLRHIRNEVKVQSESYIRTEYLCQAAVGGEDPWLNLADWEKARHDLDVPDHPQIAVIEDGRAGEGAAIALAWHDGHRVCVTAYHLPDLSDAWRQAATADKVRVGVTLVKEPEAKALAAKAVGRRETPRALATLRRLLPDGLAWDSTQLAEQMVKVRIKETTQNDLQVLSGAPSALVRCAAWAVQQVREDPDPILI